MFYRITPQLYEIHWLTVLQQIQLKLAVLAFRSLHSMAAIYLACELHHVTDIDSSWQLQSAAASELSIPPMPCIAIGDRDFRVTADQC